MFLAFCFLFEFLVDEIGDIETETG